MEERLKGLTDAQLCDVIKNYAKYNYSIETKEIALKILQERGFSLDYLKNNNLISTSNRDQATNYYKEFRKKNTIGLILYFSYIILLILSSAFHSNVLMLAALAVIIMFFISIISACNYAKKCYSFIPEKESPINYPLTFLTGPLLYFVLYYYYNKKIEEDINEI